LSEAEAVEQPKKFVLKGLAHAEDVAGMIAQKSHGVRHQRVEGF
jgi:hypothetical protein